MTNVSKDDLIWEELTSYPMMRKYGFDNGVWGGLSNFIYEFLNDDSFDGMELEKAKEIIKKMKKDCKDEIMDFLSKHGIENGGEWVYCEYLSVKDDGTFDNNGTHFGVTRDEKNGKDEFNFEEENLEVHELLQDIKGL